MKKIIFFVALFFTVYLEGGKITEQKLKETEEAINSKIFVIQNEIFENSKKIIQLHATIATEKKIISEIDGLVRRLEMLQLILKKGEKEDKEE